MGRKHKYTKEIKLRAVKDYLNGRKSKTCIADELNCNISTLVAWIRGYNYEKESFFVYRSNNQNYPKAFKEQVINEYLLGKGSLNDLASKYKIPSKSVVSKWVMMYNTGKEITDYDPRPEVYKMKSRKTTKEEKIEIVNFCLANNYNYKVTADKYKVSYSLVYQWIKRYQKDGEVALGYTRKGPNKKINTATTPEEQAQAEIKQLKIDLARKELEIEILKKKNISKNKSTHES